MRCDVDATVIPLPEIRLYHSRRKCAKFLRRIGIRFDPDDIADAQTWVFDKDGNCYAVVLMETGTETDDCWDIGVLAHEATHVMLYTLESIGEKEPAEEEMCYITQCVTQVLAKAHFSWKSKKNGV